MAPSASRVELTPLTFLVRSAEVFPDRVAVVHGDVTITYAELAHRAAGLAEGLRAEGLRPGDRVAFLAPNIPAMIDAHFGVPAARGILVPLNVRMAAAELEYVIGHSGARFVFADAELAHLVRGRAPAGVEVVEIDESSAGDPYERFLARGGPVLDDAIPSEDAPITITYTSGTTGRPKGVVQTHRATYLSSLGQVIEIPLVLAPVVLWTLPMFHGAGWAFVWAVTAVAGRHVCLRRFDPATVWRLLAEAGVTHFNGAPTVLLSLLHHEDAHRLDRPVTVGVAGAPPSEQLLDGLVALNLHPVHVYGLTETLPHTISVRPDGWDELPASQQARLLARQGVRYLHAGPVRVVDEQLQDVPPDGRTSGEVLLRGNNVSPGYFQQPDETSLAFRDGWFHTGDLAVRHPDGAIELRDRKKDVIVSGGENISTIEVEHAICSHPAVLECAVVAAPDARWGERPVAFVTLKDGARVAEQELLEHCRLLIARYKCPDRVTFGPLPKTATGKIQKFALRERARVS